MFLHASNRLMLVCVLSCLNICYNMVFFQYFFAIKNVNNISQSQLKFLTQHIVTSYNTVKIIFTLCMISGDILNSELGNSIIHSGFLSSSCGFFKHFYMDTWSVVLISIFTNTSKSHSLIFMRIFYCFVNFLYVCYDFILYHTIFLPFLYGFYKRSFVQIFEFELLLYLFIFFNR